MDVDGREMGSAPKIDPKCYISGIWGHPLGIPPRVIGYIVRNIFSRASFALRIVFLYLEPFRSYLASMLTLLINVEKFNIFGFLGETTVCYRHVL